MKIEREIKTVRVMIEMFCRGTHQRELAQCAECAELFEYAKCRLERCVFGEGKPACVDCSIHCYRRDFREKMQAVMRYSGPRMIFRHPWLALCHLRLGGKKEVPKRPDKKS